MDLNREQMAVLGKLHEAGFEFIQYDRFADFLGASKGDFVILLKPELAGWETFGEAGYRFPGGIGVLVVDGEGKKFVYHEKSVRADDRLLADFEQFKLEIHRRLSALGPS